MQESEPSDGEKRERRRGVHSPAFHLVRAACVVVVFVLLAELFVRAISPNLPTQLGNKGELVVKRQQLAGIGVSPVILMGDSMMDSGGDPKSFDSGGAHLQKSYNAAILGAPLSGQQSWLKRVVLPVTRPSLVLQAVNPVSLTRGGDRATVGLVDGTVEEKIDQSDDTIWASINGSAADISYLVRYRHDLRSPQAVYDGTRAWVAGDQTAPGHALARRMDEPGFWERSVNDDGHMVALSADQLGKKFNPANLIPLLEPEANLAQLDSLLDLYVASEVPAVVVIPPIAIDVWQASGVDVAKWRAVASQIVGRSRERGFAVVDFTEAGYDRSMFHDYFHLNDAGSRRFSTELSKRVQALCVQHAIPCG